MEILLDKNNRPIFCKDCGSVNVSIKEKICYSCGSEEINTSIHPMKS